MQAPQPAWQPNRRQFLVAAAGALALPMTQDVRSCVAEDASPLAKIDLGFSLYGMKSLPLAEALDACAKIGYSHVELALLDGFPTSLDAFTAEARQAAIERLRTLKLRAPCLMLNLSLAADDKAHVAALAAIIQATGIAQALDPRNPPILETVLGGKPDEWEKQKWRMSDRLNDWASAAKAANASIAIKAHVNSGVNSPERLLWLLDQVNSRAIHITYDYSHFELAGIDLEDSLKMLLPRTKFIHLKDTIGDAKKFQFLLPGEGRTDYVKYFSLLTQHKYTGPICVEVSSQVFNKPEYEPIAAATKCYAALSAAAAKV